MSKKKKSKKDYNLEYIPAMLSSQQFMDFDHSYKREGIIIPEQNRLFYKEDDGFFFGVKRGLERESFVGKLQEEDGNILIVGGPGSSKTTGFALTSLGTWTGRIIALDIKGNGGDMVSPWFDINRGKGKRLKVFNPTMEYSSGYDPYAFLQYDGEENLIHNARDLALAILPTPPGVAENRVWIKLAQNLLTGAILYYYELGATFNQTMLAVQKYSVEDLVTKILEGTSKEAKFEMIHGRNTSAEMFISKLRNLKPEILAGIGMDFGEFITLAVDPLVRSAFCTEEKKDIINWNDFISDEDVYDVILQIPENKLEQWEPMTTLMINQLTKTLERRADKHSTLGKTLLPVLIMLDEFPRLGTCHAIKNGLATLRSRGITFALFIQTLAQLDERYGVNGRREILGCCSYKVLINVMEPDDQEYFSRLIGTVKVGQRSISASLSKDREVLGYSSTLSEARERAVEPEELGALEADFILLTPKGFCRVSKVSFFSKFYREIFIPKLASDLAPLTFSYR